MRFHYYTYVDCETQEQADQVMAERLGFDEDYGFVYQVDYRSPMSQPTPDELRAQSEWHDA